MTKKAKEPVFLLVKSLTKAQKRQFKLFASRIDGHKEAKFIQLFDFLDKAEIYDEKELSCQPFVSKPQLANLKSHLYKKAKTQLISYFILEKTHFPQCFLSYYRTLFYFFISYSHCSEKSPCPETRKPMEKIIHYQSKL